MTDDDEDADNVSTESTYVATTDYLVKYGCMVQYYRTKGNFHVI